MSQPELRFVSLSKLLLGLAIAGPVGFLLAYMFPGAGSLLAGFIMFVPFIAVLSLIFWVLNGLSLRSLFFWSLLISAAVLFFFFNQLKK